HDAALAGIMDGMDFPARLSMMVRVLVEAGVLVAVPVVASAQAAPAGQVGPVQLPPVTVTAQKEPADVQTLPVSVTAVSMDGLADAGVGLVRDAAIYSPNTQFSDFTARKLSNPRVRGIGSSPANPSITTYFDGVPQLNSNSSSIDLLDVEQIEFVRGPQSALFGRNTLAGVINVNSLRPSLTDWSYTLSAPLSNFGSRDVRGSVSGPLVDGRVGVSGSIGFSQRDGFTRNRVTGRDIDSREALFGKGQVFWTPTSRWETRLIVTGERARDGDYALSDLGGLREDPYEVSRDFEGHTDRDLVATTLLTRMVGDRVTLSTTTGLVRWKTRDETDLDYTPQPLLRRDNTEESLQFTQEVRIASAPDAPWRQTESIPMRWQAGVFAFTQRYEQDAVNHFSPFVLSPFLAFPVSQHSPQSALDDVGVGVYGQTTSTFVDRVDLSVGARVDYERKTAALDTFFEPAIAPARLVEPEASFATLSPHVSLAVRVLPGKMIYGAVARGFKAGGFNAASPAGLEAYAEEHTRNFEGGVKTTWAGGRVVANAAVFRIDWDDLQLNLPDPSVPGQFYIANVGRALSTGAEFEVQARVRPGLDLFSAVGFTNATFKAGSVSSGVPVADNDIPNTPEYTATVGAQLSHVLRRGETVFARAEVIRYGAFSYDDLNTAGQSAYALANVRTGVRGGYVFAEFWVRNLLDTRYIPVALPFDPQLAPSGFLGESGAPRTFGISAGVTF
ncbi:MAG: TonB-dependent receptor, partial [Acidobacteria bacterium]|nr:TonB-dependent receptor [Acidobacteriota bacterium]